MAGGRFFFAILGKMRGGGAVFVAGEFVQLRRGVNLHALGAKTLFYRPGEVFVAGGEDVVAALDQFDLRANTLEELREFGGDGAAAEHNHALGLFA